jgi:SAM-dependent methyltransferase
MNIRAEVEKLGTPLTLQQEAVLESLHIGQLTLPGMPPEAMGDAYQRIRGDRKAEGAFFTPLAMAEKVARQSLEPLLRGRDPSQIPTVLDPACGAGVFLFAAYRVLSTWMIQWFSENRPSQLEEGGLSVLWRKRLLARLVGLDQDPIAVALSRIGLRRLAGLPKAEVDVQVADSLERPWPAADVVLGNPPYVRVQQQGEQSRGADLYVRFLERCLDQLGPGCRAGLVLPNRLLNARYAGAVRQRIAMGRHLEAVEDHGSTQHFAGASTYTCLLFLTGDPSLVVRVQREGEQGWVDASALREDPWPLRTGKGASLEARLAKMTGLGEVAKIFVGVQTSADRIFHLDLPSPLEEDLRAPLLSGRDVRAWQVPIPRQHILFPYRVQARGAELVPWEELSHRYPEAARHLQQHREVLAAREGGRFDDGAWYRYGRSQNLGIQHGPKLCVPRLVRRLACAWDEGDAVLDNVDVVGVRPIIPGLQSEVLLGLLNCRLWGWYLGRISTPFRNGYHSANRQFLERLPMPPDTSPSLLTRIMVLSRKLMETRGEKSLQEQLDTLIEDAFGVSQEERAQLC